MAPITLRSTLRIAGAPTGLRFFDLRIRRSSPHWLPWGLALALLLPGLAGVIQRAPLAAGPAEPLLNAAASVAAADFVRPDGTLDLTRGVSAPLNLSGWNVTLDPARGPVLSQQIASGTWNALGTGLNSTVNAIAVSGSDVYVGGAFTDAGGNANADRIARWNGSTWIAL